MTFTVFFIFMSAFSLSIIFSQAPLTLGLWLIIITLISSLFISFLCSKWLGITLFLVYVGGLLVIFTYFSAISPNQLTDMKPMLIRSGLSTLFLSVLILPKLSFRIPYIIWGSQPVVQLSVRTYSFIIPLCVAALILFFTIVIVIKIAPNYYGPLRPYLDCYYSYCFESRNPDFRSLSSYARSLNKT